MIDVRTPLTAIAATPRKEPDNKFTFSPKVSAASSPVDRLIAHYAPDRFD